MGTNATGAARADAFASQMSQDHLAYLSARQLVRAASLTGVRSITGQRGDSLLMIPYRGKFYKTYQVGSDDPWRQKKPKNARLPLWRIDDVDFRAPWLLTEGEFDAMAAIESGFDNVTSLPDGAVQPEEEQPAKSGKLSCIREEWDRLSQSNTVILALDNDEPGNATKNVLIEIFGRWRCNLVEYPEHPKATGLNGRCKDLNECLLLCGPAKVAQIIYEAKPVKLEGVFKPLEIQKGAPRQYYSTGIEGLDENLKLFRGELCIWTGHTGHGKSTTLFNVLGNLAQQGLQIGLGAFEADFWEDIHEWFHTWLFGKGKNEHSYSDTTAWLQENFTIIAHDIEPLQNPATIEWFIQQAQDAKGRYGIDVLVCDPWNKLQHRRSRYESEPDYIGRALAELRNFARVHNCIVIVSAHPTKDSYSTDGKVQIPHLGSIHGAMNWSNAADHVVVAFRPNMIQTTTCLSVLKSRFKKGGKPGNKWFVFDEDTNKYSPLVEHLIPDLKVAA